MNDVKAFALTLNEDENYILNDIYAGNIRNITLGVVENDGNTYNVVSYVVTKKELEAKTITWLGFWAADQIGRYQPESEVWLPIFGKPYLKGKQKYEISTIGTFINNSNLFIYQAVKLKKIYQKA